ncbi:MAG: MerR family transcriptional regulator [archaeon]|nr:MerR family transcriptional regulator [archaeon]
MSSKSGKVSQIPIGRFSLMTQLSQKALRIYDKKGLLIPGEKDEITGYRYYTVSQLERGIKIKMLVTMGFGISEIIKILDAAENNESKDDNFLKEMFSKRLSEVQIEIERLKKIEEIIVEHKPLELLYMNVTEPTIKEIPKIRVISKRELGTYSITIGTLIRDLMRQIYSPDNQRVMVRITGPIMCICHDGEYKEKDADIEVLIPVSGRITVTSEAFEVKNLSGGQFVSVIYTGPYSSVGDGHTKAYKYAIENGYKIIGNQREIYINSPDLVEEEQLMTEIQIQIEK